MCLLWPFLFCIECSGVYGVPWRQVPAGSEGDVLLRVRSRETGRRVAQQGARHSLSSLIASGSMLRSDGKNGHDESDKWISVVVGPEGDFTSDESRALQDIGDNVFDVSLGQNRLRTETAAIALVSALQLMLGDE